MDTRIFCDGACKGNPGVGGWGTLIYDASTKQVTELGGRAAQTTNNRMELTAGLEALKFLQSSASPVTIFSDSKYLIDGITSWIKGWKKKGWKTSQGGPVLNQDLWKDLDLAVQSHNVKWEYVKAHAGIPGNERVDHIAHHFAVNTPPTLFCGKIEDYFVDIAQVVVR